MIVRILGHGQFRLDDDRLGRLNELDNAVAAAVGADDEAGFARAFAALIAMVEGEGTPVPDDELVTSDHVLPHADTTLEEARETFAGEGAIPG
jgi:PspA-Associated protein